MSIRVGVDIGGTFTDLVLMRKDGDRMTLKVASTPNDYSEGIVAGILKLVAEASIEPDEVSDVVHATTIAANAILETNGARTALITTDGFRDVLEMRRLRIPELYNLRYHKPEPLVPRRRRYTVPERTGPSGEIMLGLDESAVRDVADDLRSSEIEAVAISLIHSYARPRHELRIAELLAEVLDDEVFITCSCEALPEAREYERTSTTVVNAYIGPVVRKYLESLVARLRAARIAAPLRMMQSGGGTTTAAAALRRPAHIIESGPAAGVVACARLAAARGLENVISLDVGGTTAKTALIEQGVPVITNEFEVGAGINISSRLVKGGGYAVKLPYIDISEIGAGGGSILRLDGFGRIQVGPDSAGASPGPACYGAGGTEATLTDAFMVLGYLNPQALAGGAIAVDCEKAVDAIDRALAGPLRASVKDAAAGAVQLAVAKMTRAVKAVSTYRGRDPREFTLCAFGGNGPVIAAAIADELEIERVLVPPSPGVFSAAGLVASPCEYHFGKTVPRRAGIATTASELERLYAELETQAREALTEEAVDGFAVARFADVRYFGQAYELTIPVNLGQIEIDEVARDFAAEHRRTYGHASEDPVQVVQVRLVASRAATDDDGLLDSSPPPLREAADSDRRRRVYLGGDEVDMRVVERGALQAGPCRGPIIIEEYDSTCVVPPGWSIELDPSGNIELLREDRQ